MVLDLWTEVNDTVVTSREGGMTLIARQKEYDSFESGMQPEILQKQIVRRGISWDEDIGATLCPIMAWKGPDCGILWVILRIFL